MLTFGSKPHCTVHFIIYKVMLTVAVAIAPAVAAQDTGPVGPAFDVVKWGKSPHHVQYDFYTEYLYQNGYFLPDGGSTRKIFLTDERKLYEQALLGDIEATAIYALGAMGHISFQQPTNLVHDDPYQARAAQLLLSAANKGEAAVHTLLSLYHRYGLGTEPNQVEAARQFEKALALGDIAALNFHTFSLINDNEIEKALESAERLISLGDVTGYDYKTMALEKKRPIPARHTAQARQFFDSAVECWEIARTATCGFMLVNATTRFQLKEEDKQKTIEILLRLIKKKPADNPVPFQSIETEYGLNTRLFIVDSALGWGLLRQDKPEYTSQQNAVFGIVTELEQRLDSIGYPWKSAVVVGYHLAQTKEIFSSPDFTGLEEGLSTVPEEVRSRFLESLRHINNTADEISEAERTLRVSDAQVLIQAGLNSAFGVETNVDWKKASQLTRLAATINYPASREVGVLSDIFAGGSISKQTLNNCEFTCYEIGIILALKADFEKMLAAEKEREAEALRKANIRQQEERRLAELRLREELTRRQKEKRAALQREAARAEQERRLALERDRQRRRDNVSGFLNFATEALTAMVVVGAVIYTAGAIAPLLVEESQRGNYGGRAITASNLPSACSSDFDCDVGSACLKKTTSIAGICTRTVNQWGNQVLTHPNPRSVRVGGAVNRCTSFQQCPIGFTCNLDYKVCVK